MKHKQQTKSRVDDGYAGNYVQCPCGSNRVQLFSVLSKPRYANGRRVHSGGERVGVRAHCLKCGKSQTVTKSSA